MERPNKKDIKPPEINDGMDVAMWYQDYASRLDSYIDYLEQKVKNNRRLENVSANFRFSDWVDGKYVDETVKAKNVNEAILIMNEKYPKHDFALIHQLF